MNTVMRNDAFAVGYAEADLQAPLGGSMPGYFTDRKATGFLDPLKAKAVVLNLGGDRRGAIVALDLVGFPAELAGLCRSAVETSTKIAKGCVWIHATHTHTGAMVPRKFTSDADSIVPGFYPGEADERWVASLPDRIASVVKSALDASKPSLVRLGQSRVEGVAFYRRFKMKDGKVATNPGKNNPNVVGPAGAVDPTLTAIEFPAAKTIVAIFGVHPDVIGGTLYSADYPAHLTRFVKAERGPDWNVLFLNAACGNINHIDVEAANQKKGKDESERIGRDLADGTIKALKVSEAIDVTELAFASRTVPSRLRRVPENVVNEAERLVIVDPAKARSFNGLFAPAAIVLGRTKQREQAAEISAMRLGPIGLVGLPGEIFIELAREIQHDSPLEPTRVIGLTNGALGYIPTAEAFDQGGYETGYRSARFEPGTGRRWAQTAVALLKSLLTSNDT